MVPDKINPKKYTSHDNNELAKDKLKKIMKEMFHENF
jgi:hypothetical protein